jgi:hypothetical protein
LVALENAKPEKEPDARSKASIPDIATPHRVPFRKKLYRSIDGRRFDLALWLRSKATSGALVLRQNARCGTFMPMASRRRR